MEQDWVKVLTTTELYKAKVVEVLLKERNIACHILNKQDSAYVMIGEIEIYVQQVDQEQVLEIIQEIDD